MKAASSPAHSAVLSDLIDVQLCLVSVPSLSLHVTAVTRERVLGMSPGV